MESLQKLWEARMLEAEAQPGVDYRWDRQFEILGLVWGQGLGEGQLEGINIIKTPWGSRSPMQQSRIADYFLHHGELISPGKFSELKLSEYASKLNELTKLLPTISRAPVMTTAVVPRVTQIHERGDFRRRGQIVQPRIPRQLASAEDDVGHDRLDLARWLTSPQNPLTARVVVNRLWQEVFGRGIVATSENFGVRGDRPSHPELLDWLAIELVDSGWSIKHMLRLMVRSAAYQRDSATTAQLSDIDPYNRLLARQSRLRLSGEAVRDVALAASGLLVRKLGGPSVFPPQPASVSMEGFDNKWSSATGPGKYRRGVYTYLQRTSPFAQLVTFDLPDTARSCTRRERSNTPLQALNLLNDPVFVEMAQALARKVLSGEHHDDANQLTVICKEVLCRCPDEAEIERLRELLLRQREFYASDAPSAKILVGDTDFHLPASELAAWISVASVLLNLDEFIVRE